MSNFTKLMQQAAAGAGGGDFYPYTVDNSARFDGSSRMTRTVSAGNRKTWTLSVWVKKAVPEQGTTYDGTLLSSYSNGSNVAEILIDSLDYVHWEDYASGYRYLLIPSPKLRDPSAWYHLVFRFDTTQATASDRARIYINGVQQTSFVSGYETYPSQNFEGYINYSSYTHYLGEVGAGYRYFNGYMADYNFIDGQSLDPTSFGEFKNGVWIPKAYTGSYGTNGFYLNFGNSAALGTDSSGNGNNWTVSGLTSSDQMLDTPTNNFCTLNPLSRGSLMTPSNGNLTTTTSANGSQQAPEIGGTMAVDSGKWYWEITPTSMDGPGYRRGYIGVGDATRTGSNYAVSGYEGNTGYGQSTGSYGYWASNGYKYQGDGSYWYNTYSAYGDAYEPNDVIGVALDLDNGKIWFSKNGTWQASGDPVAGTNAAFTGVSGPKTPLIKAYRDTGVSFIADANFGQSSFAYTPPTGFLALSTANLPEPTIGPNSATTSDENFNTVLYTGTGSSQSITGVGFQPDFLWIKRRSAIEYHWIVDVLRTLPTGFNPPALTERSDITDAVTSFDSDGFTAGGGSGYTGGSGSTYVAWNWKAGGSGVSNTDGSITSTVSANQDAGISIVRYTGTGASMTFGHGLGQPVDFMIVHRGSDNWIVYPFSATGNLTNFLQMENTNGYLSDSVCHTNNSTVIGFNASGARNTLGSNYMAYCFAEVEGFSKFGSWTGASGSEFIYTGFRPAFVLVKRTNTSGWYIFDNKRGYNGGINSLQPNTTGAEAGPWATQFNLYSNGFEDNGFVGDAGTTIIYMAFAESPFKYANAR